MISSAEHIEMKDKPQRVFRGEAAFETKESETQEDTFNKNIEDKFTPSNDLIRLKEESTKENPADNTVKVDEPKKDINYESKQLPGEKELKPEEKKAAENLKKQDQKVRTHEQAHLSAGGGLVKGGASYSFTTGPDGKQYAAGGEVKIDMSPVPDDPQATISKMQQVKRAALAPSDPSPQDRNVASLATAKEAEARAELNAQKTENMSKSPSKSKQHLAVDAYLKQENQSSVKNKTVDNNMLSLKSSQ